MFRITKAFENRSTLLYRIEGRVTDEGLNDWKKELTSINAADGRHIILDFAGVWFISGNAVEFLMGHITNDIFVLNCGMQVRNIFYAAGCSARMLE